MKQHIMECSVKPVPALFEVHGGVFVDFSGADSSPWSMGFNCRTCSLSSVADWSLLEALGLCGQLEL